MDEDRSRTRLRWVVVHPDGPQVLLARRDGALALPEVERPGQLWTADPGRGRPALRELLGADALLLDCLDQHEDPTARVQRATLLAVPREAPALPEGMAWVGGAARPRPAPAGAGGAPPAGQAPSPGRPAAGSPRPSAGCARPWSASAGPSPGRCARQGSGGSPASCAPPPATATSGSRPTRPRPCSSTRAWSWAPWPSCCPAGCRPPWPSTRSGAGWCWPTWARRSAG